MKLKVWLIAWFIGFPSLAWECGIHFKGHYIWAGGIFLLSSMVNGFLVGRLARKELK